MNVDVPRLLNALGIEAERNGRELWAKCPYPWHEKDSKPSWSISDGGSKNGLNYCFGCGASGNAAELVMERIGFSSYAAALAWICEKALDNDEPALPAVKLTIERPEIHSSSLQPPSSLIFDPREWPSAAKRYAKSRGVTLESAVRWKMACAVDGELAGRLWMPAYDAIGNLLDWSARTWCREDPLHKCPTKGGLPGALFGELMWPPVNERGTAELVICEGAFDAIACERVGCKYVAGLGGASKFDRWRALKIAAWGSIVIAADPDAAGNRVAELINQLARLPHVTSVKRVELPEKSDCNSLWQRDPALLQKLLGVYAR